jgi:hypothetical protein
MGLFDFLKKIWEWEPQPVRRKHHGNDSESGSSDHAPHHNITNDINNDADSFRGQGGDFDGSGTTDSWGDSSDSGDGGDGGGDGGD